MAATVHFLPAARVEFSEAQDWYEQRSPGLAFVREVDRQVQRVAEDATGFPLMFGDVRRVRLRRFPCSLFYRVVAAKCFVLACFHASCDPKQWRREFDARRLHLLQEIRR